MVGVTREQNTSTSPSCTPTHPVFRLTHDTAVCDTLNSLRTRDLQNQGTNHEPPYPGIRRSARAQRASSPWWPSPSSHRCRVAWEAKGRWRRRLRASGPQVTREAVFAVVPVFAVARSRQARPEEAQQPRAGTAKGGVAKAGALNERSVLSAVCCLLSAVLQCWGACRARPPSARWSWR